MSSLHVLIERWRQRRDLYLADAAMVSGEKIAEQVIRDLESALSAASDELVTLTEASVRCGFSADYLGRLVRSGRLSNHGRRNAPRVAVGDLPRKPGYLPPDVVDATLPGSKRRTALSVISAA